MQFVRQQLRPFLYKHIASVLTIALTTLLLRPFEPSLQIQLVALLYLLPVMISTVFWGLTPGILASFLAFLVFNYYYIIPYYTFQVHKTQDLITLIVFLVLSVVLSQLIGQAREGMRMARMREWEATRMYELISALAGLQDTENIAQTLALHTRETFQFQFVEVSTGEQKNELSISVSSSGQLKPGDTFLPPVALRTARSVEGEMRIRHNRSHLSSEETRLLEAFTSQGALSLERTRLFHSENKARVLEESDRLKTALLNSVSHELRSPLAVIKASVSSLRSNAVGWNTIARQELLATIEEETDHLNWLVGELLDMSRIESKAMKPQKRWNSIEEIVTGVAIKMRKQLQNHNLELDFPEDLPLVPTDYVMIERVITNLISNSVKYAPVNSAITIRGRNEADMLQVQVKNEGPPVPGEELEQIFEKFHRVTEADRVTGTGLGLSICKGIIEAHGGKIWAENQTNGFIFHFVLPLALDGNLPQIPKEVQDG